MHLTERRRRKRLARERCEDLLDRCAELLCNDLADLVVTEWRHRVLQLFEFCDVLFRKDIVPCAQNLPELDVGRSKLLEHQPEPFRV